MKLKLFFITLLFFPLPAINAQCKDCFPTENDWKFAAGVTLVSNMTYSPNLQIKQPLEFNFRYKLTDKQLLRASIPIAWKTKVYGYPTYPVYPLTEITAEDYVKNMQLDLEYNFFKKVMEYYYNTYGISLGYEYDFPIASQLTIFGGLDVAYYHQYVFSKYYELDYSQLKENYQATLDVIVSTVLQLRCENLTIKPLMGIRYQFQKLILEGSVGYYYLKHSSVADFKDTGWYNPSIIKDGSFHGIQQTDFYKFTYNISLFYTF